MTDKDKQLVEKVVQICWDECSGWTGAESVEDWISVVMCKLEE